MEFSRTHEYIPMIHRRLTLTLVLSIFSMTQSAMAAPRLVTDLSERRIDIEYKFAGANVLLFGAIEGLSSKAKPDVVVIVRGPTLPITVRRKSRVLGIWMNTHATDFLTAPSYYALASTGNVNTMAAPEWRAIYEIGIEYLHFSPASGGAQSASDIETFRNGFVATRRGLGLFSEQENGVELIDNGLFRTRIMLPARVPIGDYRAEIYLFTDKKLVARQTVPFIVEKTGFERSVFEKAHRYPFSYGVIAVLTAVLAGWTAAWVFRK